MKTRNSIALALLIAISAFPLVGNSFEATFGVDLSQRNSVVFESHFSSEIRDPAVIDAILDIANMELQFGVTDPHVVEDRSIEEIRLENRSRNDALLEQAERIIKDFKLDEADFGAVVFSNGDVTLSALQVENLVKFMGESSAIDFSLLLKDIGKEAGGLAIRSAEEVRVSRVRDRIEQFVLDSSPTEETIALQYSLRSQSGLNDMLTSAYQDLSVSTKQEDLIWIRLVENGFANDLLNAVADSQR